ncbi:MAG: GAF domain-containing protein [Solirubrobacterales bacterium]|nr:GAF domain-containing protein [Solirubrobacterales bacterium]
MAHNLITRLGVAAGIVAAAIAFAFLSIISQARMLDEDGRTGEVAGRIQTFGIVGLIGASVALLLLAAYLARYIVIPMRDVTSAAEELAGGDLTVRVREQGDAEPVALAHAFNELASNLQTEQQQTEVALTALAAEKRRIETFHRAGERLAAARDLTELATIALAELMIAAGADSGGLWAVEPDDQRELVLEAAMGVDPAMLPRFLRPDDSPAGRAITTREAVAVDRGKRSELHLPLVVGSRAIGVMSLYRDGTPAFPPSDRDTLLRLAEQVSVGLSNAVSYRSALRAARVNRAVLDATPDPVGLLGSDGELVAHNAAMAEIWRQYPGVDVGGGGGEERDVLELGPRAYSRYAGPVRDDTGERMGRLVVLRDITAERESERLKDEFFALVSHELRTPLTSIIGYLELVCDNDEELSADTNRFLEVVDRNAKRLLRLVGDMLFVAQVEAGRLSLERVALDLGQVLADSVEAARPTAERAGVRIRLETTEVGHIDGDRDRVGQLVDNLVSNALKFTAEGGEVVVAMRAEGGDRVLVAVGDDGMGIPAAEQQHLFERFFRSSTARSRAVPGVGLGLTIVKTIVEAHDGEISLESKEGVGTIVRVLLPLRVEAAA